MRIYYGRTLVGTLVRFEVRPGRVCSNIFEANFTACELSVKRVVTFVTNDPYLILHFAELLIDSSIRYKNTLFGNYFLQCNKVKIILIPFNTIKHSSIVTYERIVIL